MVLPEIKWRHLINSKCETNKPNFSSNHLQIHTPMGYSLRAWVWPITKKMAPNFDIEVKIKTTIDLH